MTYQEAIEYIHSAPRFSAAPTLERITALLAALGNPQNRWPAVHIAGTNGKGSVSAITESVLRAAGFRTGLFTSPYLERFNERMCICGQPIPDEELAEVTETVKEAAERAHLLLNEFELVTAVGFLWFAEKEIDVAVIEVGLGGRYDATNVLKDPLACVITSISLDHTAVLGNTVGEIAGEKAGIIKPYAPCIVSANQKQEAIEVIRTAAKKMNAPLTECSCGETAVLKISERGFRFRWHGSDYFLSMAGGYQAENVCTVLNLIEVLRNEKYAIPENAVIEGLNTVKWPGRMEYISGDILLDCGHNPGGIDALCEGLDTLYQGRKITAIMGMLGDKSHQYCISEVAKRCRRFIAVAPPSPRAMKVEMIAEEAARNCGEVICAESIGDAFRFAEDDRAEREVILVCGSIPLTGEARTYLRERGIIG